MLIWGNGKGIDDGMISWMWTLFFVIDSPLFIIEWIYLSWRAMISFSGLIEQTTLLSRFLWIAGNKRNLQKIWGKKIENLEEFVWRINKEMG